MNRLEDLDAALASVRAGSQQPYEIIVSDDGGGNARGVAERYGAIFIVGPQRGLGANRNAAIARSTGDLIAFIDDDVIVSDNFVAKASHSSTSRITTGWEQNFSAELPRKVTPHNASFLGFQKEEPHGDYRSIVINATVFPRTLFDSMLFDEAIRYGYEEIDMARHAVASGWTIIYNDELWVEHHPSAVNRDSYSSALNVSRLYITHKSYRLYDRSPLRAALFNLIAFPHHLAHVVKKRQRLTEAFATLQSAREKQLMAKATTR